jgi:hypothetical protein
MKLSEWIKKNKLSYSQAANQFGIININPATNVQRYAKGQRIPHPVVITYYLKIQRKLSSLLRIVLMMMVHLQLAILLYTQDQLLKR